jgi:hypothetical protein
MWLNGYSGNKITDMELKKLIAMHGGMIRSVYRSGPSRNIGRQAHRGPFYFAFAYHFGNMLGSTV